MKADPVKALLGTWRLLSVQLEMADTKERFDLLGAQPSGRIIFQQLPGRQSGDVLPNSWLG